MNKKNLIDDIFNNILKRIKNIQTKISIYDAMVFSNTGKALHKEINGTTINNIHYEIQKTLFCAISLEISKLFDESYNTWSFNNLVSSLNTESHEDLRDIYNKIKGSHRLQKIKLFRNRLVAHHSSDKIPEGCSQDDIDCIIKDIISLYQKLFLVFNVNTSICIDISNQTYNLSERYWGNLLHGFRAEKIENTFSK